MKPINEPWRPWEAKPGTALDVYFYVDQGVYCRRRYDGRMITIRALEDDGVFAGWESRLDSVGIGQFNNFGSAYVAAVVTTPGCLVNCPAAL